MSHLNSDDWLSDRKHLADNEQLRLEILAGCGLLNSPAEREFDMIVLLAQRLLVSKIALVSFVDEDRLWLKAAVGIEAKEAPRELAFCGYVVASDDVLVVPDATQDSRFSANPLVTGEPNIRFYAGVPIRARLDGDDGVQIPLGALCVVDDAPRSIAAPEIALLRELAHFVEELISAKAAAAAAVQLAHERSNALHALDRKHRQLRQAERIANIGSWRLTLADNQTEWSEQTYAIHGVPVGDGPPLDAALQFYPPTARSIIEEAIDHTVMTGAPFDVETDFMTAQGAYRRVRSMGELEIEDGKAVALIGVFQDITARFEMEEKLRRVAHTDELTRLASRSRFNEYVDEKIDSLATDGQRCALLLIDLDHFKAVNDRCGHLAGDEVLRIMASRLQASYLDNCFAARLGGDEFVLLVTDQALLENLRGLLSRLLGELQHCVSANGAMLSVSATIGACWLNDDAASRSELLRNADTALYSAKRRQRGSAMIAGETQAIFAGMA